MEWLNNLKTANKILFLISTSSLFLLLIGFISLYFNFRANERMARIYKNNLQSVKLLNEIRTHTRANQADTLSIIGINNLTKRQSYIADIDKRSTMVDEDLSAFQRTYLDKYEEDKLKIIKEDITKYRNVRTKAIDLALAGNSKEAFNYFENNIAPLDDLNNMLGTLADYNVKQAKNTYNYNKRAFVVSLLVTLGTILLTLGLTIPLGKLISNMIADPLESLSNKMQQVTKGSLDIEPAKVLSKDEIGDVSRDFNTMTQTIKDLIQKERIRADNEESLRKILIEIREFENHDEIYNYLLAQLIEIFNVNRGIHLHYDKNFNLHVINEILANKEQQPLIGQMISYIDELHPSFAKHVIVINDVDKELKEPELKDYLKEKDIRAFVSYPTSGKLSEDKEERILGLTIICSNHPRNWLPDEIDFYKLVVETVSISYLEMRQRQEVDSLRKTFLATLTHDLRSPINAEQKALEAILSSKLGISLEEFSVYLEDIYKTNEELLRIVNNILTVYHYESGKFELKLESNDIKDMICDSVRVMGPLAKDQDSKINVLIEENLPPILSDKDAITRVITNLISNAIKHNRKGTDISIESKRINNEIQVSIQDNGSGIPEAEKPKIFQRYPTEKRKIGTGLGLYLSKQIIDMHHGRIWFDSEVGKGTTFYFTLPIE